LYGLRLQDIQRAAAARRRADHVHAVEGDDVFDLQHPRSAFSFRTHGDDRVEAEADQLRAPRLPRREQFVARPALALEQRQRSFGTARAHRRLGEKSDQVAHAVRSSISFRDVVGETARAVEVPQRRAGRTLRPLQGE